MSKLAFPVGVSRIGPAVAVGKCFFAAKSALLMLSASEWDILVVLLLHLVPFLLLFSLLGLVPFLHRRLILLRLLFLLLHLLIPLLLLILLS